MNPLEQYSLQELKSRTSEKWQNYPEDVLPLWVAEMDVKLPSEFINQLCEIIKSSDLGYLSMNGFKRYAQAFSDFAKRHWNWQTSPEDFADVPDVVTGCRKVIDAFLEHNSKNSVIVSTPVYPPFINSYTKDYQFFDAPLDANYRLDFKELENKFANATKDGSKAVYALCNPGNPSGTVNTLEELTNLAKLADEYGVLVVSDEIHGALVTARNFEHDRHSLAECASPERHGKHSCFIPYLSVPEANLAVTVTSASKAFSIPGIKAALVIPSNHPSNLARELVWNSGNFRQASSEHLGVIAQSICLESCDDWLHSLVLAIRNNLTFFKELTRELLPKAKVYLGEGTYFAWIDFSEYNIENPAKFFLKEAKVALNPGSSFAKQQVLNWNGLPKTDEVVKTKFDSFVRMNLATSTEIIRQAVTNMAEALEMNEQKI